MKKRVASAFLVLTLLMSIVVVPVSAEVFDPDNSPYDASNVDDFIEAFVNKIYALTNKDQFVDFLVLLQDLENPTGFKDAYLAAFAQLDSSQQGRLSTELGITADLIADLAQAVHDDPFTEERLNYYLADNGRKSEFIANMNERRVAIETILSSNSVTDDHLDVGFTKMDNFFDLVDVINDSSNDSKIKLIEAYNYGNLDFQSDLAHTFLGISNALGKTTIENIPSAVNAMSEFVDYYNGSLSSSDKQLVYTYLYDNGFIKKLTSGGGSNDDDDDTPAPVTPVTPPVNETVDELTKDLEEKETEEVIEAIDNALDAINDSLEQGGTLEQIEELSTKLIVQLGEITEEENKEELVELITDIAENAIEQAGRTEAETADLTEFDFSTISTAVNDMNETMQESLEAQNVEADKEIEVKVTVTVPTVNETEVEVELPPLSEVFNEENKLDSVKLESEVASFEFGAGTFGDDSESVKIGAKVISANDVPEQHKEKVPQSATVVDLNAYVGTEKKTSFEKPIKVTVKYELKEGESADNVSVFLLKDDGTVVEVGGVYNEETGTISFLRDSFSLYYVSEAKATFNDIDNYPEAKKAIEVMAGKGIVKGRVVGVTFDPAANITRAEFACMITRALKIKGDASKLPFVDVPTNAWYINDMAAAYQNNIVNGTSETKFAPSSNITREQAIAMVVNALSYMGYNYEDSASLIENVYTDFSELSTWFHNSTATAYREDLIQDVFTGTELDPKTPITRAETAMLLYNLYFK